MKLFKFSTFCPGQARMREDDIFRAKMLGFTLADSGGFRGSGSCTKEIIKLLDEAAQGAFE